MNQNLQERGGGRGGCHKIPVNIKLVEEKVAQRVLRFLWAGQALVSMPQSHSYSSLETEDACSVLLLPQAAEISTSVSHTTQHAHTMSHYQFTSIATRRSIKYLQVVDADVRCPGSNRLLQGVLPLAHRLLRQTAGSKEQGGSTDGHGREGEGRSED